jgi:hypothetical protein
MRKGLMVLLMALGAMAPASAQVSIGIGLPNVSIGINLPLYPEFVRVPGYPVYYAPRVRENFFFYDGLYWVFHGDNWYASSWYQGPWELVTPEFVPLYILRVPVRYYRQPPGYFRGWHRDSPPRWGDHWGDDWSQRRSGWDRWNRRSAPAPAPLPSYQRKYSGDRYPSVEQQQALHQRNYRYQPRDPVVRQRYEAQRGHEPSLAPRREMQDEPQGRRPEPRREEHSEPPPSVRHDAPTAPSPQPAPPLQRGDEREDERGYERRSGNVDRGAPPQSPPHRAGPPAVEQRSQRFEQGADRHPQPPPKGSAPAGKGAPKEEHDQGRGRDKADDRDQDRGR